MLTRSSLSKLTTPLAIVVAALLMARCGGQTGPSGTAPTVASIDPNRGPAGGGTSIHIVGDHFAGGATVMIGGVPATDIVVESATSITAKTGAHATGASDVTVTVAGRSGALAAAFTYETDTAPVIKSVTAQGTRPNEPKNFADLDEEVTVTAVVEDPDTAPERLTFEWTAEVGTFSGTGATVTWRAPADASTPKAIVLNVKVSDPGSNSTTGSATLSLHNSRKEVGDLSRQFLLDFSDSNNGAAFVVRNFTKSPALRGRPRRGVQRGRCQPHHVPHHVVLHWSCHGEHRVRESSMQLLSARWRRVCERAVRVGQRLRARCHLHARADTGH